MGFAIADELAAMGADVILISGPSAQKTKHQSVKRIDITTAAEMLHACEQYFESTTACVMSAAVADYASASVSLKKIKKQSGNLNIEQISGFLSGRIARKAGPTAAAKGLTLVGVEYVPHDTLRQ